MVRVARTAATRPAHDREARVALALVPVLAALHALVDLDWQILAVDGFAVFTAGVVYLLRLMAAPPHHGEQGLDSHLPARAAGITPAAGAVSGVVR